MPRLRGLGDWKGPFWSRVLTALVFLSAGLAEWLIRRDDTFAALWCFVALIPAALAVGTWHSARTGGTADGDVGGTASLPERE